MTGNFPADSPVYFFSNQEEIKKVYPCERWEGLQRGIAVFQGREYAIFFLKQKISRHSRCIQIARLIGLYIALIITLGGVCWIKKFKFFFRSCSFIRVALPLSPAKEEEPKKKPVISNYYAPGEVETRFFKKYSYLEEREKIRERGRSLADYALSRLQEKEKKYLLQGISIKKEGKAPADEELNGKIYALALKVEGLLCLQKIGEPLPKKVLRNGGLSKKAPHVRLFGDHADAIALKDLEVKRVPIHLIIEEKIGKGGFNRVFRSYDITNHRPVAYRSLKNGDDKRAHELWEEEWRMHERVFNGMPYVVKLHCVLDRALILDFCEASLSQWVFEEEIPLDADPYQSAKAQKLCVEDPRFSLLNDSERKKVMEQILSALISFHEKVGYVHRDMKPQNVLIKNRKSLEIAICDFGYAEKISNISVMIRGAWPYQLPEIFDPGQADFFHKFPEFIDTWAAGIIAYELKYGTLKKHTGHLRNLLKLRELTDKEFRKQLPLYYPDLDGMFSHEPQAFPKLFWYVARHDLLDDFREVFGEIQNTLEKKRDPYDQMIAGLLCFDPKKRWTAKKALEHLSP